MPHAAGTPAPTADGLPPSQGTAPAAAVAFRPAGHRSWMPPPPQSRTTAAIPRQGRRHTGAVENREPEDHGTRHVDQAAGMLGPSFTVDELSYWRLHLLPASQYVHLHRHSRNVGTLGTLYPRLIRLALRMRGSDHVSVPVLNFIAYVQLGAHVTRPSQPRSTPQSTVAGSESWWGRTPNGQLW